LRLFTESDYLVRPMQVAITEFLQQAKAHWAIANNDNAAMRRFHTLGRAAINDQFLLRTHCQDHEITSPAK
jgi:hypothetical protein